jgi:Tol biopolymer transport system component
MTLAAGSRLGPYEILEPLGAGGMGEVYRARDTRLGREVAVKVLPSELSGDSGRLRRFEKEARSASSLNHPNIVTVYDIGTSESVSWIAMELVEGVTLRRMLATGPLLLKKLLGVAAQVAEGLARAHEAGIVHRDLKPENVMVTKDGFAKILDFGLAKLTPEGEWGEGTQAPTVSGATEPGMVVGTVAYMSPEQALGKPLDFRSDQFSFGAVLFEMLTGKRAFGRSSGPETMTAIIREEPEALSTLAPKTPTSLRWLVERCLSKEPRERYASTDDLAAELRTLRDRLVEATTSGEVVSAAIPRARARVRFAAAAAAGLLLVAALSYWVGGRRAEESPPSFRRLSFRRGTVNNARFASDGQTIVYEAAWEEHPEDVFFTRVESMEGRSLGFSRSLLFALSNAGEMAIGVPGSEGKFTLARAPLAGGAVRSLIEDVGNADWAPNGKSLAVIRNVNGKQRLEFPVGKLLCETTFVTHLRVSPDGNRLALLEHPKGMGAGPYGSVVVVDRSGKTQTLATLPAVWGLAWSPSGREIWFSAHDGSTPYALNAVTLSGRRRVVASAPISLMLQDISAQGRLLVTRVTTSVETFGHLALDSGEGERNLTWMDRASAVALSPDGGTVLYSEIGEGHREGGSGFVRKQDGSIVGPFGQDAAITLSPDGKWILARRESPSQFVLIPIGPGEPTVLPRGNVELDARSLPHFFADGKRILYGAAEPGRPRRCYVQDVEGGEPRPVTPEGTAGCVVPSPDGKFVIARDGMLYPLEGGKPQRVPGLAASEHLVQWSADGKSIYVRNLDELPAKVYRLDLATGHRQLWKEFAPSDPAGVPPIVWISISPDGKSYVYSYDRVLSDLYLVEGLK